MTGENQKTNIRLEMEQAGEVLREAEVLKAGGLYRRARKRRAF